MTNTFNCWNCGKALTNVILPFSRREECVSCGTDQHVCKMCVYFDENNRLGCNEERAEQVVDRERANFCDYFEPSTKASNDGQEDKSRKAKAQLAALFGDEVDDSNSSDADEPELTPAELAEKKLRDMLNNS